MLETPESDVEPDSDLIAAYSRMTESDFELRFDLLGSPDPYGYTLIVLLDFLPGGSDQSPWGEPVDMEWDVALTFPAAGLGHSSTFDGKPSGIRPRILRLEVQDAAVVRLSKAQMAEARFTGYLIQPGEHVPADSIGPSSVNGKHVAARAPLLLVFSDVLPSATPAQALRRWNGAHTGPFGQRHGLEVLLDAAQRRDIPLALLDIKHVDRLPALDALGGLAKVQKMARQGLLLLPDLACGDAAIDQKCVDLNRQAAKQFGLPGTPFIYHAGGAWAAKNVYAAAFRSPAENEGLCREGVTVWIPPPAEMKQVTGQGLQTTIRAELLQNALAMDTANLTILGGALPSSPWGDFLIAGPSMEFIAGHPWIQPLSPASLSSYLNNAALPECAVISPPGGESNEHKSLREELARLPDGIFSQLAWLAYLRLAEPVSDPSLRELRDEYLGVVHLLIAAAQWEAAPTQQSYCGEDLDRDGFGECVLASPTALAIIQPQGARLVLAAARQGDAVVQFIGPRSQMVTGLGDPMEWRLGRGLASDPQEIAGAFGDSPPDWQMYHAAASADRIILTSPDGSTRKTFQLLRDGLHVFVETTQPGSTSIPLLLNSQSSVTGWLSRYQVKSENSSNQHSWGLKDGPHVLVTVQGAVSSFNTFTDSLPALRQPEDPNAEMPPGAFLPFRMAVVEVQFSGNYDVKIVFSDTD